MNKLLLLIAPTLMCLAACTDPSDFLGSKPHEFSCASFPDYKKIDETFLFDGLRRYAYSPSSRSARPSTLQTSLEQRFSALQDSLEDPLLKYIARSGRDSQSDKTKPLKILLLSGGGQWGAFGAGFLSDLNSSDEAVDWDIVTGISTGAMQAMFVGAGDYEGLIEVYDISYQSSYASKNGPVGLIRGGSQYDTGALREAVLEKLVGSDNEEGLLVKINDGKGPSIRIGMVEAKTGDFYRVNLTKLIKDNYSASETKKLADCVAGIVMASSGVPAQLSPVKIDDVTFFDGGVRESVFIADLASDIELSYFLATLAAERAVPVTGSGQRSRDELSETSLPPPQFFVLRNGPTVLPNDDPDGRINDDPDIWQTAMRGYATLVNQNELTSITSVLLEYPRRPIKFVSADGYNWVRYWDRAMEEQGHRELNCKNLNRPTDQYFSPPFMECLLIWGKWHRSNPNQPAGWSEIANPSACRTSGVRSDEFGTFCDAEFADELRDAESQDDNRTLSLIINQYKE